MEQSVMVSGIINAFMGSVDLTGQELNQTTHSIVMIKIPNAPHMSFIR